MEQFLNGLLKENSGANGQISEDVQAILLGAEYETQRAIKRALNDFLFLKTLTEKMKNGPETTDTGLAKWIAVHTRDEKFAEALTTPDLFLLAAWETYRLNDTKNNILTWNKIDYKFDSNGDLILSDVQKESERQKALSASKSSDNGETEHPETDEALENDLHQRWSNFFNRWRHKPVFMYPFIKEGKRDFGNEDACKAYQHLNQYIAPAEPEQTKKSKDKTPRIVNGYTIEPGAFLEGADLKGADLEGANLKNAHLFAANLEEANLRSAKLFEADLIEAILITADLRRADLRVANLRGTDLFRADLMGASLREADLIGASLWEADLRRADLRTANFSHDEILKARNWDLAIYDAGVLERLKTLAGKME
ncbi:MAG: hypothetical protein G3M78_00215 [Candidatus Nitrohelix vancouverensis]|uniref:Pentapeptide repeat-containing protein n=1 Tax=Candidatus Nitrohelix vancouverensis TaxID=2705534 RepID=A0A7T0C5C8_9BACT|nr:MAG: hypothetical protein G3M78_00215 [Candidatus Nitrohelix vancouverensis]